MADKVFIDSNVWIYSFIEAEAERDKRRTVLELFEDLSRQSQIVTSLQVVNEAHWTLQRRYKIEEQQIREFVEGMNAISKIVPVLWEDYQNAYDLRSEYSLSFWDSLIVAVALRSHCDILYSEDMQHNLVIQGRLRIQNPLLKNVEASNKSGLQPA